MRVTWVETLACDAGWRPWIFVRIETDNDLVGWAEVTDTHGSRDGVRATIDKLAPLVVGRDPRPNVDLFELDVDDLPWKDQATTRVPETRDGVLTIPDGVG